MKKLTAQWVRKAEADLLLAGKARQIKPPLHDLFCFHCQQAAEKYLKACLQERAIDPPRTHNLLRLLDLLLPSDPALRALRRGMKSLSRYAVDFRYPGASATARQARSAVAWAERVRFEIRFRLGLSARQPRRRKSP